MSEKAFSVALSFLSVCLIVFLSGPVARTDQSAASNKTGTKPKFTKEDHIFGQRILFESKTLAESKAVYLHFPESYEEGTTRYPVLFVLDGGDYFEPFAVMVKYPSLYEMIPEMIVVAVAHGDRMKEFTFTKANAATGDWATSGGAESFRKFLTDELIPHIDSSYRTHPFRILVGHSLAGLFAVETLARSPNTFQATIALSPSLYWDQFEWLKNAGGLLSKVDSLKHFLFIMNEQKDEAETAHLDEFKKLGCGDRTEGIQV
jgi:predicted alpha/beta superfamily hydrolase